ncbi:K+/H+ antiporter subunit F [Psychromonas algicola]|uniref:K+/H+ antiporter subunit F n=1 Tax=Psychromonas algicola TaxID=2555642 RepID=UPI0010686297|nr:K+/H+ antiporter subunit F [Psychromonas sp. RZ5]TEW51912.1 K+/H+ antiporter subunit F [Psychromonas sp. RZ5]
MLSYAILIACAFICCALALNAWRLIIGPTTPDRIIAVDTMYINSIALIILLGLHQGSAIYYESALLIALLGFVSTSAFCKYLLRGDIIE